MKSVRVMWVSCAALLAAAGSVVSAEQGSQILLDVSAGTVALDNETRVEVSGLHGEISVRAGKEGELRFVGTTTTRPLEDRPVRLMRNDRTIEIAPAPGTEDLARRLEISVAPGVAVVLEVSDSAIVVNSLHGDLEIRGRRLQVRAGNLKDSAEIEVESGSVDLRVVEGDLSLRGSDLSLDVVSVAGLVYAKFSESHARFKTIPGEMELDLDDVELDVDVLGGPLRLQASAGRAEIRGLASGGEIRLVGTPLVLASCTGKVEIESDAEVRFQDNEASLYIKGYGAPVSGSGNKGLVEIVNHGAEVVLEKITGPVRVQGDGLQVQMQEIEGEVVVLTNSSTIDLRGTSSPVTIENEDGDVTMRRAAGEVTITSREGDVHLTEMKAAVHVDAEGDEVAVSWVVIDSSADSVIRNDGGNVSVLVPAQDACRIHATSRFGRIESELPDVIVSDDGSTADGTVNGGSQPIVKIESEGVVQLGRSSAAPDES